MEYLDSDSDIDDEYKHITVQPIDQADILNESKEWDTDLEIEGLYLFIFNVDHHSPKLQCLFRIKDSFSYLIFQHFILDY